MFDFLTYTTDKLQLFILILVRTSGLFIAAPILSQKTFPNLAKIGLAILMALILLPIVGTGSIPQVTSLIQMLGLVFKELFIGTLIGFVFLIIFSGIQGAGAAVGYQMGMMIANALDPVTQDQNSIVGTFWSLLASLIFLSINGHHLMIQALSDSYLMAPVGQISMDGQTGVILIKLTAFVFIIALKIASPVIVTLFLTDISLGTLAKMMPTMNVFFVGFPLKVGVGLSVIALSLPLFRFVFEKLVTYFNGEMGHLLMSLGKA